MERVTRSEYKRRLSEFIKGLTPKLGVGMYNVGVYMDKINTFKEGIIIVNDK